MRRVLTIMALCLILISVVSAAPQIYLDQYNSSLKLNMHMNGTEGGTVFTDDTGKTVTRYGAQTNTSIKVFGSASGFFNGTANYLTLADSDDWNFGSGNFTISLWANFTSIRLSTNEFVGQWHASTVSNEGWILYYANSTDNLIFYYSTDGTTLYHLDYAWEPTINTPYHIVVARSGNTLHAYINGVELGSGQSITHTLYNSNKLLYVGNDEAAAPNAREFVGYLDELAIWKGVAIPISELHPQITEIETVMMDANFTISNTSGFEPLLTHFTDTSTTTDATIDAWNWSFDDGEVSSTQSPDHTYVNNGTYSVNLTIINTSYSLVSTKIQIVTVYNLPNADFSSFNTQGTAPFTTYFYDTSTNLNSGPYTYYTDFGDGNTSTEQNLYFTWNATGTYDVKHCITDSMTTVCNNKTAYITVGAPTPPVVAPVASFYGGPQTGNVPLTVFFTDVSSNAPTSWLWEFGDGSNSTLQNPQHQYTSSGFRTVNLTATNSAGSNVTTRLKFVKVS